MRGEDDFRRLAAEVAEDLVDLRRMAMRADAVRGEIFVRFRVVEIRLRRAAGAANAALAVDDNPLW